jgi:hypothetical protein
MVSDSLDESNKGVLGDRFKAIFEIHVGSDYLIALRSFV